MLRTGQKFSYIAEKYNVSKETVSLIKSTMTVKGHQKGKYANESAQFVLAQARKSKAQRDNEVKKRIEELKV